MKASTIERIKKAEGRYVVIGRYTYRFDPVFGRIVGAKTSERDREWLDSDGRHVGPWKVVHEF